MNKDQGWLNLYKPKNISSFHAIKKVKSLLDIKKIGHAGTLDPLAEGILPIAIGKTTKLIPYLIHEKNIYLQLSGVNKHPQMIVRAIYYFPLR